jgi:hypothetical protein
MKTLIINSTNVVSGDNSRYVYNFPINATFEKGDEIAVSSISIYYSWFNITSLLGNNTFSYIWPVGPVTINVTIPDGFYTANTLNSYLQSVMITNNHYLIDTTGNYVYYFEFVENSSAYAIQFNSYPIPIVLPAGWSTPTGWTGYPVVASTPQIVIPSTNIRYILGFNAGTYPTVVQATNYSKVSDFVPQFSPVQSCLVSCSLVNNNLAVPPNIIFGFAPTDVTFGSIISPSITYPTWNQVTPGSYPNFQIQFLDQSFNALPIRDTNLVVMLSIRNSSQKE